MNIVFLIFARLVPICVHFTDDYNRRLANIIKNKNQFRISLLNCFYVIYNMHMLISKYLRQITNCRYLYRALASMRQFWNIFLLNLPSILLIAWSISMTQSDYIELERVDNMSIKYISTYYLIWKGYSTVKWLEQCHICNQQNIYSICECQLLCSRSIFFDNNSIITYAGV